MHADEARFLTKTAGDIRKDRVFGYVMNTIRRSAENGSTSACLPVGFNNECIITPNHVSMLNRELIKLGYQVFFHLNNERPDFFIITWE